MTPIPHTHLRPGNIVRGVPFPLGFLKDESHEVFALTVQEIAILEMGKHQVYGVPITPEVLERCGFVLDASYDIPQWEHPNGFFFHDAWYEVYPFYSIRLMNTFDIELLHLHQLQNLFFAVTGEELSYTG